MKRLGVKTNSIVQMMPMEMLIRDARMNVVSIASFVMWHLVAALQEREDVMKTSHENIGKRIKLGRGRG